ncbi:MAG: hypothetical protein Q9219_007022 [cf. Caloplaca sp. 3 TL-2023]
MTSPTELPTLTPSKQILSPPSSPPKIPERCSSKRALDIEIEADRDAKRRIEKEIDKGKKGIKARGSFNAEFWSEHKAVSDLQLERHKLVRRISKAEFQIQGGEESLWEEEPKAVLLREENASLELKNKLLGKQMDKMGFYHRNEDQQHRQWIIELISGVHATKGGCSAGSLVGQGQRDDDEQSAFHEGLVKACKSEHPDERSAELWCPILGSYNAAYVAAHIYPYGGGQLGMDQLFGRPEGEPELFSIKNGLIMSVEAEKRISNGWIVLVPDLMETASAQELYDWTISEPKEYKIRVLDSNNKLMKMFLPLGAPTHQPSGSRRCWWELDNQPVQFLSDHRPRARYLYWQFAVSLLRKAYNVKHREENPIAGEFGKRFWGTKGPWIRKKFLLGFVENLGHEIPWENLLEAAAEDEGGETEADLAGVLQANHQIDLVRERMKVGWPGPIPEGRISEDGEIEEESGSDSENYSGD